MLLMLCESDMQRKFRFLSSFHSTRLPSEHIPIECSTFIALNSLQRSVLPTQTLCRKISSQ